MPDGVTADSFGSNNVYYNDGNNETDDYYAKLTDALAAVYKSSPEGTAEVYCKPDADVGIMTHAHVADNLVIYGNGAKVTGGEYDLEIDTYKYSRETGKQDKNGVFLDKDITVTVKALDGASAWGQRNTSYTVNLVFENCKNMKRVYYTNSANKEGVLNITLTDCTFVGDGKGASKNTSIYSNSAGEISANSCEFEGVAVPFNMNNKSQGTQTITVNDCSFKDCSTKTVADETKSTTYAAPIRVLAQEGATSNLVVKNANFVYSGGNEQVGNGDVLLGDGRFDRVGEAKGTVTLAMTETAAQVQVQTPGYFDKYGAVADESKGQSTDVKETDVANANTYEHFTIECGHGEFTVVNQKDATCTEEGYTGDKKCNICGEIIEKGSSIAKVPHKYSNGVCTVCGAAAMLSSHGARSQKRADMKYTELSAARSSFCQLST